VVGVTVVLIGFFGLRRHRARRGAQLGLPLPRLAVRRRRGDPAGPRQQAARAARTRHPGIQHDGRRSIMTTAAASHDRRAYDELRAVLINCTQTITRPVAVTDRWRTRYRESSGARVPAALR
jgi:hypothetical protein